MFRWAIGVIVITVAGCQGATANVNPFGPYGPTQVPPPPTGTAGRLDPYYRRTLANRDAAGGDARYAQTPARSSRITSDDYRNADRATVADRRGTAAEPTGPSDAGRRLESRGIDADRSSYDRDPSVLPDSMPETQLDWRRPDAAYRDTSLGVRSGMVRPRFVSSVDSFNAVPGEPAAINRAAATAAAQLRPQAPLSGWTSANPTNVARQPYNGWSR